MLERIFLLADVGNSAMVSVRDGDKTLMKEIGSMENPVIFFLMDTYRKEEAAIRRTRRNVK